MPESEKIFYTLHQTDPTDKKERQIGMMTAVDVETAKKKAASDARAFGKGTTFKVWRGIEVK